MGCNSSRHGAAREDTLRSHDEIRFTETQQGPQGNFHKNYVLHKKVGQGGYCQVHLACKLENDQKPFSQEKSGGSFFGKTKSKGVGTPREQPSLSTFVPNRSVKIVDLRMKPKSIVKLTQNEVKIWKNLGKHNNIVRLLSVKQEFGMHFLITEMCSASLLHYLSSMPVVDERTLGESFAQMLLGIEFLHNSNVVHRDIKPDHFVVGGDTGDTIKLCDFTLATKDEQQLTSECGTALFMAPEMLLHRAYDAKVDIWSFGVIVYALLLGRFPYDVDEKSSEEVKQTIAHTEDAPSFRTAVAISSAAIGFTKSLICRDPLQRPSAITALKNKFMIDIIRQKHEVDSDLPSLKHQLHQVKQLRAFQNKDLDHKSEIDDMLSRNQLSVHGLPLLGVTEQASPYHRSSGSVEEHHKSSKRNSFINSEEIEKFGFTLGEKVKCAEVANGVRRIATEGHVVGFTDFLVLADFPGCTRSKFKPTQLLKIDNGVSDNKSNPSSNFSKQDSLVSVFSTLTGSTNDDVDDNVELSDSVDAEETLAEI
jgi:serine/threonine protein kinase